MKLVEKNKYYSIEEFFPSSVIAGFTKTNLEGREVVEDIESALRDCIDGEIKVAFMHQLHSDVVNVVDTEGLYEGDALFTDQKRMVLVVKAADCLPLFFYDDRKEVIGMVHLGWRSAKEGMLDRIPLNLGASLVVAGVALRKCCFKVNDEFLGYDNLAPFVKKENDALYYDPIGFSRSTLISKGLNEDNFKDINMCTYCHNFNFYSYRRDKTENRMLSFILKI